MKIEKEFFVRDTLRVAKDLVGKVLVRKIGDNFIRSRIVETEAYTGQDDKACHTYMGKRTPRTEVMYKEGGYIYVYLIYGIYSLLNFVTNREGLGQAVLIRAVEPLDSLDLISKNRFNKDYEDLTSYQRKNLTNGPGRLTKALNIDKSLNTMDLFSEEIFLEDDGYKGFKIIESNRIGVDYAEEAAHYPYRFYIENNKFVSKN